MRLSKQLSSRQTTPVVCDEVKVEAKVDLPLVVDPVAEFVDLGETKIEYEDHVSRLMAISQRRLNDLEEKKRELESLISKERKWFDGFNLLLKQ